MEVDSRQEFMTRCNRVAIVAKDAGVAIAKAPRDHAVVLTRNGASVSFPIVSDDRDWRDTSAEEALYAAIADAFAWASARPGEAAFATLDATERSAVPSIKQDFSAEVQRIKDLAQVMGGMDGVRRLWQAAGIDANAAAAIELN